MHFYPCSPKKCLGPQDCPGDRPFQPPFWLQSGHGRHMHTLAAGCQQLSFPCCSPAALVHTGFLAISRLLVESLVHLARPKLPSGLGVFSLLHRARSKLPSGPAGSCGAVMPPLMHMLPHGCCDAVIIIIGTLRRSALYELMHKPLILSFCWLGPWVCRATDTVV